MNKIYKLIWSKAKNCWVVASELAKGHGKNKSRIKNSLLAAFVMSALLAGGVTDVQALTQQEKEEVAKYLLDKIAHGGEIPGAKAEYGPTNFPDAIANRIFYYNDVSSKIGEKLKKDGLTLRYFGVRPDYYEPSRDYLERYANKDWTNVDNDGAFGAHSMALGYRALSEAKHGVAIGRSALAGGSLWKGDYGGDGGVAIGNHAWALGDKSVSVGNDARAVHKGIAIGIQAEAGLDEDDNTTDWSTAPGFTPKQGKSIQYDPKTKLPYVTSDLRDKMGAIAIGIDAKAHGNHSTAMGVGAKAKSRYAWSFGYSSEASGVGSIAFGSRATAKGTSAIAIGSGNYDQPNGGAQAYSEDTIAIGRGSVAGNKDDTATAYNTVAIGVNAKAKPDYTSKKVKDAVLLGANTTVKEERGIAVGANAYVDGASGAAFGDYASVVADEGLAIGKNAKIAYNSTKSIAIGSGAEVKNENANPSERAVAVGTGAVVGGKSSDAIVIGTGAQAQGDAGAQRGIAIGKGAIVKSYDSVAIGTNASTKWYNAVAIGNGAQATLSDGIALGSDSKTTVSDGEKGYDPYTGRFNIDAHPGAAWESTKAALSVGDVENNITRQITSVAAGRKDTDAVNVAQLKKMRTYTDTKMSSWVLKASSDKGAAANGQKINNTDNAVTFDVATNQGLTVTRTGATIKYGVDSIKLANYITGRVIENINGGGIPITNISTKFSISGAEATTKKELTLSKTSAPNIQFLGKDDETTVTVGGTNDAPTVTVGLAKALKDKIDKSDAVHYFSVKSGEPANPAGTNWDNKGATGQDAIAIGSGAKSDANGAVSLGQNAKASVDGGVALGTGSVADTAAGALGYISLNPEKGKTIEDGYKAMGAGDAYEYHAERLPKQAKFYEKCVHEYEEAVKNYEQETDAGKKRNLERTVHRAKGKMERALKAKQESEEVVSLEAAWKSTQGAVSVGGYTVDRDGIKRLKTRQITGVAAGTKDSDAVNVAQLKASTTRYFSVNEVTPKTTFKVNFPYTRLDEWGYSVHGNQINDGAKGEGAVAVGENAEALQKYGSAFGYGAKAKQEQSLALGLRAEAEGSGSVAMGGFSIVEQTGKNSLALGQHSRVTAANSVALGAESFVGTLDGIKTDAYLTGDKDKFTADNGVVSVGRTGYKKWTKTWEFDNDAKAYKELLNEVEVPDSYRRIVNVAGGAADTDAVNVAQLKAARTTVKAGDYVTVTEGKEQGVDGTVYTVKGPKLTSADTNLAVTDDEETVVGTTDKKKVGYKLQLSKTLTGLESVSSKVFNAGNNVTLGETGLTIIGGPSVTTTGIDANNTTITKVAAGAADTDAVNFGQLKDVKSIATTNQTNITKLQNGFTVKDGGTGSADVTLGGDTKQEVTFKAAVDKTTQATENGSSLTSTVDTNRNVTYSLNMKQLKKDLGITDGPDGVMSSWKLKATGGDTTEQDIKNGEAVTFDASGNGLTVKRDGKTIKYGIDGSKIDITNNQSITKLGDRIDKLPSIHYFSVNSTDKDAGSNYKNDGATGADAIAIGKQANATGTSDIAIGTEAQATGGWGVAIGQAAKAKASTAVAMAYGAEAKGKNSLAIGILSEAKTNDSTAYGREAKALGEVALAVGMRAKAEGDHSAAFGAEATTDGTAWNGTAIGRGAYIGKQAADGTTPDVGVSNNYYTPVDDDTVVEPGKETKNSTAVGFGAKSFGYQNTAVGAGAEAFDTNTVAVGVMSKAIGHYANALGKQARAEGTNSTAIGHFARALGESSMALGDYAITSTLDGTGKVNHSVALGSHARVAADNSLALGNNSLASIADDVKTEAYLSKETFKKENGVVSVGNSEYTIGDEKIKQNYRRITNVAGGAEDNDAVNVAQLKALEGKVTDNAGDITTLKEGWTLEDAAGSKKVVKAKNTVKVTGDDYIKATVNSDGLTLGMNETKLNTQINNQIDNSETVKAKMNSWVLKATSDKDAEKAGKTIDNKDNAVTFDATGNGLTVTRDGSTIKYGIDGSKIDITGNKSITDLQTEIKESKTTVEAAANSQITVTPEKQNDKSTKYVVDIAKDGTIDGDKDGNLVTGETVKKYVDANKVTVTGDEEGSGVKVENVAKTGEPANYKVSLGDKVKVGNVVIDDKDGKGSISGLSEVTVGENVTLDKTGLTIKEGPSVTTKGIDAGKKKITNVKDGDVSATSTDAVNGKQLFELKQTVEQNKVTVEAAANSQITVTAEPQNDKSTKYVVDIAKDGTIGGAKDGNLVTGKTVKDYVDANKVTVTGDEEGSGVKVENTAAAGQPANYKVSLGDKVKAGDVTVDGTKGAGQITGLSNTKWDADKIVSGRAATEDQLKAVSENAAEAAKKHTTVVAGDYVTVSEGTNANGGKEYTVTGPKVSVAKDEKNLVVGDIMDGNKKVGYELKLNKELTGLTSVSSTTFKAGDNVTINNEGLTIKEGPSVTTKGIDAGKKKITNVAAGDVSEKSTEAVNGGQLFGVEQKVNINSRNISILGGKVSELNTRVNRVGAGAAALAALHPLDFDPDDKWDFAAGYGNYKGANAAAIGAYYRPNEDTMVSVGGSFGGGENMVNAGVSVKLGQGNHVTTSRVAMAKEIKDLRAEVEVLRQAVTGIGQGQTPDPVKMKLFPDIAKNHWAYEAVEELTKQGLLEGYPDGTFGGDRMMTRYEFATLVYRAMQKGLNVNEKLIQEFEPELERFRIDVISKDKNGNPVIERVRVNEKKKAK